jgi:hypothetical protein
LGDDTKEDETGRARGTYGAEEECIQNFGGKPEGKRHLQDLDRGGRILIKRISKKYDKRAHSTHMVQDKDKWHVLVNPVTDQWVP